MSFIFIAECPDTCGNCASCYLPSMCTCDSGWQGNDCCTGKSMTEIIISDINECNIDNGAYIVFEFQLNNI